MRMITAALTGLILTIGSAASCVAADLPREDGFGPGPGRAPFMDARVVCDAVGRCFRVRPHRGFYGPEGFEDGPRYGRPPQFGGMRPFEAGPGYGDEPRYGERGGPAPGYWRRGPDEPRYGERRVGSPGDPDRRPDGFRRPDDFGPSQMRPGAEPRGAVPPGAYPRGDEYGERY